MRGDGVKAEVGEAIEELKRAFPSSELTVSEDGEGGARVVVESVAIGARYEPEQSWLGGPHSRPVSLCRHLSGVHGRRGAAPGRQEAPITAGHNFCGRPAIQISRRNNRIQNSGQTAVAKFLKILDFLEKVQ